MIERQAVGFLNENGNLVQWLVSDCKVWELKTIDDITLFSKDGQFVELNNLDCALGNLAKPVTQKEAATKLLGAGFSLPVELVHLTEGQYEKSKNIRSKKRPKPKRVTASKGLGKFLKASSRRRDHGTRKGRTTNADSLENQNSDDDSIPPKSGE